MRGVSEASKTILAGAVGLEDGRKAHILGFMNILDEVWNELDVAAIARC